MIVCMRDANSEQRKDKTNKKLHRRTSAGHVGKLSCYAQGKHKRDQTGKQMYTDGCHCLQPEKIIEVGTNKSQNSSNGHEKGREKP